MSAEYFLDTDILVYAFDQKAEQKRTKALILGQAGEAWGISWQVVQEFCSVAHYWLIIPWIWNFSATILIYSHCPTARSRFGMGVQRTWPEANRDSLVLSQVLYHSSRWDFARLQWHSQHHGG